MTFVSSFYNHANISAVTKPKSNFFRLTLDNQIAMQVASRRDLIIKSLRQDSGCHQAPPCVSHAQVYVLCLAPPSPTASFLIRRMRRRNELRRKQSRSLNLSQSFFKDILSDNRNVPSSLFGHWKCFPFIHISTITVLTVNSVVQLRKKHSHPFLKTATFSVSFFHLLQLGLVNVTFWSLVLWSKKSKPSKLFWPRL